MIRRLRRASARATLVVATAVAAMLLLPGAAHAADAVHSVEAPAGTALAWIELEQAGLSAASVVVEARVGESDWQRVALTATTFGLHGELPVTPGTLQIAVRAAGTAAASSPDLAVTLLDAAGSALDASHVRLAVPAGADDGAPATVVPIGEGTSSAGGALAATGGTVLLPVLIGALASAAVAAGFVMRARSRRERGVDA